MEIRRGIVKAFDLASYTATVQVAGSLGNWLAGVPVAKHLSAGLLTSGARCGVIFFDPANPQDACLAFVYEGTPGAWVSDGMLEGNIAGSKVVATTTTARGTVELAEGGEVASGLAVQANDPRLSDARTPTEHDASKHQNRTRYIPLFFYKRAPTATAIPVSDDHGNFVGGISHWDCPDGVDTDLTTVQFFPMPPDYVAGTVTLKFLYLTTVTGGNIVFVTIAREVGNGDTGQTTLHGPTSTVAAPAANTMSLFSINLQSNPTAGKSLWIWVRRDGDHANDTNTGTVAIYSAWLEYTADM